MGKNLTILQKGLLLIAVPVVFQLLFIAALFKLQRESIDAQYWAMHTQQVIVQTERLFRSMLEALNNSRGYVITGNPVFAENARHSTRLAQDDLAQLHLVIEDNPVQVARIKRIQESCDELIAWTNRIDQLLRENQRDQAVVEIKRLYGKQLFDALRHEIDGFLGQERQLDVVRRYNLERSWKLHNSLLTAGIVAMLLLAVSMLLLFYRNISHRLALLAEKAQLLGAGKALPPPLAGNDEIAQLDQRFHDMAKSLAERTHENELFIYSASRDLRLRLANLRQSSNRLVESAAEIKKLRETDPSAKLDQDAYGFLESSLSSVMQTIHTEVEQMGTTIESLLELSRAGRVEYRWQNIDLQAIARGVLASLDPLISSRPAQVVLQDVPPAWGDVAAVEQLLQNLLSNAAIYLDPERPGRIEFGSLNGPVGQTTERHTYYVKDNGLGIPKDCQSKLFFAFQRFHPSVHAGDGIGLALVRRVVDRHGGEVWAESAQGIGTTIYFTLPAARNSADGGPDRQREQPSSATSPRPLGTSQVAPNGPARLGTGSVGQTPVDSASA